jgi:type VI secretion system protein ImpM
MRSDTESSVRTLGDPAGWFGKLPSLGDFANRRLPPEFIEAWDDWLSRELAAWKAQEPDSWLQAYLQGPCWRFVLMPGVLPGTAGRSAWAGVLMPSVDRVGRYFPFTLAQALPGLPADAEQAQALLGRLHRLDDLALDALHEDWSVEQLEAALCQEQRSPSVPAGAPADIAAQLHAPHAPGTGHWLRSDALGQLQLHCHTGLPGGAAFATLLTGEPSPPSHTAPHHDH